MFLKFISKTAARTFLLAAFFLSAAASAADSQFSLLDNRNRGGSAVRRAFSAFHQPFELTVVKVSENSVEPVRIAGCGDHWVMEFLNGAERFIIVDSSGLSYFAGDKSEFFPKSMPAFLWFRLASSDPDVILRNFMPYLSGEIRSAGTDAELVRLCPSDGQGYGMMMTVGSSSVLMLDAAAVDRSGSVIEQYTVTGFSSDPSVKKGKLCAMRHQSAKAGPEYISSGENGGSSLLGYLPVGYKVVAYERKRYIDGLGQAGYFLVSNGIFDFSVYLTRHNRNFHIGGMKMGENIVYHRENKNGYDVAVVGMLPMETAELVAASIDQKAFDNILSGR